MSENYIFDKAVTFADTDSFLESGIIDSTGVLQLVTYLEETYGIAVEDDELTPDNLDCVNSVAAYLSRKLNGSGEAVLGKMTSSNVRPS
ncbi:MAG TPA: phosphopantetheine-binding protein [Candidatus Angelobacter sp.]|nr:phosphopantetheine-binding protein [Candidatus Angelobacter sp.]